MAISFIPYDGWRPSSAQYGDGWGTATNLAPIFERWSPWHQFVTIQTAFSSFGPMVGSHTHLWPTGLGTTSYVPDAATVFTGSPTRLFTVNTATGVYTDVSRAANYGAGVGATPAGWRFASVGNDVWGANWFDVPQRRVANAGLFTNGVTSAFVPIPRHLAVIREHLVVANLNQGGRFVDELAWSDADNAANFDPPTATSTSLAGSKRLVSIPGQITGLLGGQYGLAFKRKSIFLLEYTGTTQVLRPEILSPHVGTAYGSSIVNTRTGVYFFGPDGFYRMVGLSEPQPLSPPGLNSTVLLSLFSSQGAIAANTEDSQMVGFEVPGAPLVCWIFRTNWALPGNDQILIYNTASGEWATGTGAADNPGEGSDLATTAVFTLPYGATLFSAVSAATWDFSSVSQVAPLSDTAVWGPRIGLRYRPAALEEAEDKATPNPEFRQSIIKGVLPVFSRGSAALTASVRVEKLLDPFTHPAGSPLPDELRAASDRNVISGYYPFQIAGRFFKITIEGVDQEDFQHFHGVYIDQELLT